MIAKISICNWTVNFYFDKDSTLYITSFKEDIPAVQLAFKQHMSFSKPVYLIDHNQKINLIY